MTRCNAYVDGHQCRKTKNLSPVLIDVVKTPKFADKLPDRAIVELCPAHLRLTLFERLVMASTPQVTLNNPTLLKSAKSNQSGLARRVRPNGVQQRARRRRWWALEYR